MNRRCGVNCRPLRCASSRMCSAASHAITGEPAAVPEPSLKRPGPAKASISQASREPTLDAWFDITPNHCGRYAARLSSLSLVWGLVDRSRSLVFVFRPVLRARNRTPPGSSSPRSSWSSALGAWRGWAKSCPSGDRKGSLERRSGSVNDPSRRRRANCHHETVVISTRLMSGPWLESGQVVLARQAANRLGATVQRLLAITPKLSR